MNWYDRLLRRKSPDVIPNPRDNKRKAERFDEVQRIVLHTLQFFCFAMAVLILLAMGASR